MEHKDKGPIVIGFSCDAMPVFQERKLRTGGYDIIAYGSDNNYPNFLIDLYNGSAKHNAIINGKVTYIFGKGMTSEIPTPWDISVNQFGENLNDITKRITLDIELFGGAFIQIIPNAIGGISDIIILPYWKVRSNKQGSEFYYKKDWKDGSEKITCFKHYIKGSKEPNQILYYKEYRPGIDVYTLPGYVGAIPYIQADIEVGEQVFNNAQGGFTASKTITFFNGEPTPDAKAAIEKRISEKFTGKRGKKFLLEFIQANGKKMEVQDLGASDLTKEDFAHVDLLIQQNVYSGHQIVSPVMFGIATAGALGQRNEIRDAYELFKNGYINAKQQNIERLINGLAKDAGQAGDYHLIHTDPINFEFSEQTLLAVAPKSWLLEKIGIDATMYPDAGIALPGAAPVGMVNDAVKNLTGRQHQQLLRIIRQYGKEQITREVATTLLKTGLGLSDEEITTMLGDDALPPTAAQMSFSADDIKKVIGEFGEPLEGYSVIRKRPVHFEKNVDSALHEFNFNKTEKFEIAKIDLEILKLIQGDKLIKPEVIADALKIEVDYVKNTIDNYIAEKVISVNKAGEKEVLKPVSEISKKPVQIFIKYTYELNTALAAGPPIKPTTRPFCEAFVDAKKFYTRSEIELISERLGYSVWDRRGGFWTHGPQDANPGTTTAYCRHLWHSNVIYKR